MLPATGIFHDQLGSEEFPQAVSSRCRSPNPKPKTQNPKTLNPKAETLKPKPETLNPTWQALEGGVWVSVAGHKVVAMAAGSSTTRHKSLATLPIMQQCAPAYGL